MAGVERARHDTREHGRRTQAERTAVTRRKIMAAVVESISDVGFPRTTAAEIARRAGVTWGAVQHHFGGKDGILLAVLEDSFDRFASGLADGPTPEAPLAKRVSLFIDRAWEHFRSDEYRSTLEILLSFAGPEGRNPELLWQGEMFLSWNRVWRKIFADAALPRGRTVALQQYTIAVLSGLASLQKLGGHSSRTLDQELAFLKDTMLRELRSDA